MGKTGNEVGVGVDKTGRRKLGYPVMHSYNQLTRCLLLLLLLLQAYGLHNQVPDDL